MGYRSNSIIKKTFINETQGLDQLHTHVGKPSKGDTVKVYFIGYILVENTKSKFGNRNVRKNQPPKRKEFYSTYQLTKPLVFKTGASSPASSCSSPFDGSNLLRGIELAVLTMNLGEHSEFVLSSDVAFDTQGFTSPPGYENVPPNTDVILSMELMMVNGKRREIPQDPSCFPYLCFGRNSHGWAS